MQVKKESQKTRITDIYESSVYFVPRILDDEMIEKLTKIALKLTLKLHRHFSSETGRKLMKKEFTTTELKKILGTGGKLASRNSIISVIEQLVSNKLFFVFEDYLGKEKIYTFFIYNSKHEKMFDSIEKKEGYLKHHVSTKYHENKIIDLKTSSQSTNSNSQSADTPDQIDDTSSQPVDDIRQSIDDIENAETIENTEQEPISEKSQDYSYKEAIIQETYHNHDHKESNNDMNENDLKNGISNEEKEARKVLSELKYFGADKAIKTYGLNYVIEKINLLNSEMSIKEITNAGSYLRKLIENPLQVNHVSSSQEIKPIKNTGTQKCNENIKESFLNFCISEDLIRVRDSYALELGLRQIIDWMEDKTFMTNFALLDLTLDDIESLFNEVKNYPTFKAYRERIALFLKRYELILNNAEAVEKETLNISRETLRASLNQKISDVASATKKIFNSMVPKLDSLGFDDNEPIPC